MADNDKCPKCGAPKEEGWELFFKCGSYHLLASGDIMAQSRHCAWEEASHLKAEVAALKAALAASVPRAVAERAAAHAFEEGWDEGCGQGHHDATRSKSSKVAAACLARAEREHAKNGGEGT